MTVVIGVPASAADETRSPITGDVVKKLAALGARVLIQKGATDSAFATPESLGDVDWADTSADVIAGSDIVWSIGNLSAADEAALRPGQVLMGLLAPYSSAEHATALAQRGVTAFAMELPFDKLDVVTFSWQKVLGGEGAHGVLILSPRAVERLESHVPAWPMPKIFRMTKGGKLIEGIFKGETINTPSMLCVEDYLVALKWAQSIGGQKALVARANANSGAIRDFIAGKDWIADLAEDPATASTTSVCLKFTDPRIKDGAAFAKAVARRLEKEGVALDAGAYRDAPPGLRIWCGSTVEASDVAALMPWIEYAFDAEIAAQDV